jgi:hypothetical protein
MVYILTYIMGMDKIHPDARAGMALETGDSLRLPHAKGDLPALRISASLFRSFSMLGKRS